MAEGHDSPRVRRRLFTPGPTQLPAAVYAALGEPMAPARAPDFMALMAAIAGQLRRVFHTAGDVVTLTASGTGAMEAALVNLVAPAERILIAHAGKFGERWLELADAHGVRARSLPADWGQRIEPDALGRALDEAGPVAAVFLTQSETSTGVVHDVEALAAVAKVHGDPLVIVDAVSSAGAIPLYLDTWGVDACVSASHKGLLCPPGLAFVALGPRARTRVAGAALPRFYFDLRPALEGLAAGGTPWTPAIPLARALAVSLDRLAGDGLEAAWSRTGRLARATRAGVLAAGLELFANPPGDVVTAARVPGSLDARAVVRALRERGFEIAAGQGAIKREVLRIAHLGCIDDADLLDLMDALEDSMNALGYACPRGPGRRAAAAALIANHAQAIAAR